MDVRFSLLLRSTQTRRRRTGFTLVEALVAITIISMAGAALLLATESATVSSDDALEQAIASGIAQQLLDEALGHRYVEQGSSPFDLRLWQDTGEYAYPPKTSIFDDTDDFNWYSSYPICDPWGIKLGQGDGRGGMRHLDFRLRSDYFDKWYLRMRVFYVDENDLAQNLTGSQTSGFRAAEVYIYRQIGNGSSRLVTKARRVFAYVPAPSS